MTRLLKRPCAIVAALAILLVTASDAKADILVFNNFGSGDSYQNAAGWLVGNDFSGNNIAVGETFTAGTTGTLSQIKLALEFVAGANAGTVTLRSDSGGAPGAVLESWSVSSLPVDDGAHHTPITLTDSLSLSLAAGTSYWVVASTSTNSTLTWQWSNTATGNLATSFDGGATFSTGVDTQSAFAVSELQSNTATTPEPSTLALLTIGTAALAGNRLRRRQR
jgi:PEP-CTERM motif